MRDHTSYWQLLAGFIFAGFTSVGQAQNFTNYWVRLTDDVPKNINVAGTGIVGGFISVPSGQGWLTITVANVLYTDLFGNPASGIYDILGREGSPPHGTYPVTILVPDAGVLESGAQLPLNIQYPSASDYFVAAYSFYKGKIVSSYTITATYQPLPPVITSQPQSRTVRVGDPVSFNVTATGQSLSYQWYKGNSAISGATATSYSISHVQTGDAGAYQVRVTNPGGTKSSAQATLSVLAPPTILTQPASQTVTVNSNVIFFVEATGTAPLRYQWFLNGQIISGETKASLNLTSVQTNQAGDYTVAVSNEAGSVTSQPAVLTVRLPPTITSQPLSQTVIVGTNVTFNVTAVGTDPMRYQWEFNGADIAGATSNVLILYTVGVSDAGTYRVVVSNVAGTNSAEAMLTVSLPVGAVSDFAAVFTNAVPFTVKISVTPVVGTSLYAVQDVPPTAWEVTQISDNGTYSNGKVLWVFPDDLSRTFSYVVTPPVSAFGTNAFVGRVSFDGSIEVPITGVRQCRLSDSVVRLAAAIVRIIDNYYFKLSITGKPGASYHVLVLDAFDPPGAWRTNATITLIGSSKDWVDPERPAQSRFYRVKTAP